MMMATFKKWKTVINHAMSWHSMPRSSIITAKKKAQKACNANPNLSMKQRLRDAVEVLREFDRNGVAVEQNTYESLIRVCTDMKTLDQARIVYSHMLRNKFFDISDKIRSKIIFMFLRCGSTEDARQVFDNMSVLDFRVYDAMIWAYERQSSSEQVVEIYGRMEKQGIQADRDLLACVLKACVLNLGLNENSKKFSDLGRRIHEEIVNRRLESDVVFGNDLIGMYGKLGKLDKARDVFNKLRQRNMESWELMISGYAQKRLAKDALGLVGLMCKQQSQPNSAILCTVLPLCVKFPVIGKEIHGFIVKGGFQSSDVSLFRELLCFYAKAGILDSATKLFDRMTQRDVACWDALIRANGHMGLHRVALELFGKMREEGFVPTSASWNTVIGSLVETSNADQALKLFYDMQHCGGRANYVSIANVLPACAQLAAVEQGREIHGYVFRKGFDSDAGLASGLVIMYGKCGMLEDAEKVFQRISATAETPAWNSMILAYAIQGQADNAFSLFHKMQECGLKPDNGTFCGLLGACSHVGLVNEGMEFFKSMAEDHGVKPDSDHYAVMVDLLGRAGRLKDAYQFIEKMPTGASPTVWNTLLVACGVHLDVELGEKVAQHLFSLEPRNVSTSVLLSNLYSSVGMWEEASNMRRLMLQEGIIKTAPGCSWIQLDKRLHAFKFWNESPNEAQKIYAFIKDLKGRMKEADYRLSAGFLSNDMESPERENKMCTHSEIRAISFGLLNTVSGKPIRVTKTLRICGDCHDAIKFISNLSGRAIIVGDSCRFHHFRNGYCSCGDHW